MTLTDRISSRSLRVRNAVALLMIPAMALLVWSLVILPLSWVATSQEHWRAEVRAELAEAKGRALTLDAVRKRLANLPSESVWQRFYPAENGADGGAALQRDVTTLSMGAGLATRSITLLPSQPQGRLMTYTARLAASGTAEQLQAFATSLRGHPRYLRVEQLKVTAPQVQSSDENPVLSITLDISGFART